MKGKGGNGRMWYQKMIPTNPTKTFLWGPVPLFSIPHPPPPQPQLWDPPPQPPVFSGGDASLAVACRHYFLPGSVRYKIYAQALIFFFFFLLKSNYKLLVIKICSEIK